MSWAHGPVLAGIRMDSASVVTDGWVTQRVETSKIAAAGMGEETMRAECGGTAIS